MTDPLELFRRYPEAARSLPHIPLATLPTPVNRMEQLGEELGIASLWVKRDDQSGVEYGGNKVRKLEFVFGDVVERGYERVVTLGGIGSHHALATSIYARQLGIQPVVLHFTQPMSDHVRDNLIALSTTKPEVHLLHHAVEIPFALFAQRVRDWRADNPAAYFIPGGGSSPLGALGYVNAGLELARQVEDGALPAPDVIFVTTGTGGTFAGLLLGCKLGGLDRTRVIGVRVVDRAVCNAVNVLQLTRRTASLLRDAGVPNVPDIRLADIHMQEGYFGAGYGEPTAQGLHAIDLTARAEGLHLEPTYTGKAMAALIGERDTHALREKHVLYWHTLSGVDLGPRLTYADPTHDLPAAYLPFIETEPS